MNCEKIFNAKKLNELSIVTDVRPGFVDTDMANGGGKFWVATVSNTTIY